MKGEKDKKGKTNIYATSFLWGILLLGGLVLAGVELLSGERHWSVVPTGKGAVDQAISPDETLLVVLNAGENSVSFIDLESKIPFAKLYLPLAPPPPPEEGKEPEYGLQDLEFSGDGSRLFITSRDGAYFVIDPLLLKVVGSGNLTESGLHGVRKGELEDGVLAIDKEIGKLSFLSGAGELPLLILNRTLSSAALDVVRGTGCGSCGAEEVCFAYQVEANGTLTVTRLSLESFEVEEEVTASLPRGALLGDIQRGEGGFLLGVSFAEGDFDLLWLSDDGKLEGAGEEPIEGPEGGKIFELCRSGIFITHLGPGLFTLATYDKEGEPIRLDLKPCGFDGVSIKNFSAYPEQVDSFAATVGPHQGLFGASAWEGVVVFDSSGQEILGLGNNNNDDNNSSDEDCYCSESPCTEEPVEETYPY
ncbi:MAG: hypothetical protein B1H02_05615 [Candidatus Latescibacteria bacterium 4484_107]|nr:MAG: hypothetical protein B1H02_05615 [Candidatus Latescibacteria bacterium 4484_107]